MSHQGIVTLLTQGIPLRHVAEVVVEEASLFILGLIVLLLLARLLLLVVTPRLIHQALSTHIGASSLLLA